jgi:hypothetical protein
LITMVRLRHSSAVENLQRGAQMLKPRARKCSTVAAAKNGCARCGEADVEDAQVAQRHRVSRRDGVLVEEQRARVAFRI